MRPTYVVTEKERKKGKNDLKKGRKSKVEKERRVGERVKKRAPQRGFNSPLTSFTKSKPRLSQLQSNKTICKKRAWCKHKYKEILRTIVNAHT